MYQLMEGQDRPAWTPDAPLEEPPLWFREGMASVTAGQGNRCLSGEDLGRWIAGHTGADLLHPTQEQYRTEREAVYGAAQRAFNLLVKVAGDQSVRDVLRCVREGARLPTRSRPRPGTSFATSSARWCGRDLIWLLRASRRGAAALARAGRNGRLCPPFYAVAGLAEVGGPAGRARGAPTAMPTASRNSGTSCISRRSTELLNCQARS